MYQGSHSDWKTWKTWKNGKAFSSQGKVREFCQSGKVGTLCTKHEAMALFVQEAVCLCKELIVVKIKNFFHVLFMQV